MPITNAQSGTRVDEVADRIYRIHTPVAEVPGGFSFNQYLVLDDEPLLFHTGPRGMVSLVAQAIESVVPVAKLRHVAFSHFESDECGALNQLLALAPHAAPVCSRVNAMINADSFDRPPRALADGEVLAIGAHHLKWFDTPHLPHGWECGYLMEETTRTLLCGDLFTQGGTGDAPVTTSDILGPSEGFRQVLDYFSHTRHAKPMLARLAAAEPTTLACMHGSAWQGDGAALLIALGDSLDS
jgi:flavorubredoxin